MKNKKKPFIIIISVVLSLALVFTILFFATKSLRNRPVEVYSMDMISTTYWGGDYYSSGIVESSHNQMVYVDSKMEIDEVYVKEGDTVKKGDPILSYVTTKLSLDYEKALLHVEEVNNNYDNAVKKRDHYNRLSPYVPPVIPDPPLPEPLPDSEAEIYDIVDLESVPFSGDGSEENPYRYLCMYGFSVDPMFMHRIFGVSSEESEEIVPIAVSFEVHEEDNENGLIYSGIFMNGISGEMSQLMEEYPEFEEEEVIVIPPPPAEAYSKEELEALRKEWEQKVVDLEYQKKTADLEVTAAKKALDDATIYAKEDGYISKVREERDAVFENQPIVVVSGGKGAYIRGSINEGLLEQVKEGNTVSCFSWEVGETFDAEIVEVSPYPSENNLGYGGMEGMSQTSYDFLAFIPEAGDLMEGSWLEMTISEAESSDSLYVISAFISNEEDGKYIWKVSDSGLLTKIPVKTGKTLWGEYVEVFGDLGMEDSIAFPGAKGVKENTSVVPAEY